MTDDLLTRLDDAANDTHYIDHETAREAAARIRELEAERGAAWQAGADNQRSHMVARIDELIAQVGMARIDADSQRERASAAEAEARSWRTVALSNQAMAQSYQEQRDTAEAREKLAADAAVKYIERAEAAEAHGKSASAIAFHALQRATLAEEWRDHDKTRAEAAEEAIATARRDALEEAAKAVLALANTDANMALAWRQGALSAWRVVQEMGVAKP
jgi:hypothetical protein